MKEMKEKQTKRKFGEIEKKRSSRIDFKGGLFIWVDRNIIYNKG